MQIEKVRMSLWMILQKKLCRLVIILIHLHGYQIQVLLTHIYQNEVNKMRVTEIDTVLETIICFATGDEPNKLRNYLAFLFQNKNLQKEVEQVFGEYVAKNLYAIVY